MFYVSLVKTSEGIYVLWDDPGVKAWKSEEEAIGYYERGYKASHLRGYEASASASINWLFFNPSIIAIKEADDLFPFIEHTNGMVDLKTVSSIAGHMIGVKCKEGAKEIWDKGTKPKLIDNQWLVDDEVEKAKETLRKNGIKVD